MENKKSFGAFLGQRRKELGLTQKELAQRLFVTDSAVSKWERGLAKPRADKLPQLAKLYGCTIEELLADDVDEVEDQ